MHRDSIFAQEPISKLLMEKSLNQVNEEARNMKTKKSSLFWVLLLVVVMVGCTPKTIPTSGPTAVATQAPAVIPTPIAVSKVGETAWDQIVKAAKKEGEVTIYSFNFVGDVGLAIAQAFENRYGIRLQVITGRGVEFIERLRTEKRTGQMVGDVAEGAATHMLNIKEFGLTIPQSDLGVFREKIEWDPDPRAMDAETHVLATFQSVYSPWINTNILTPQQVPKSYQDLLKPEWKGKLIAHDPNISSAAYNNFVPLVNAGSINWDYVRSLGRQQLRLMPGGVQAAESLSRGEYPIIIFNTDTNGSRFVSEGAPIKAVSWQEGDVYHLGGMVVIKDAPHPNAAKVLANWLLMEEGQRIRGEKQGIAMVRKDVPDFRPPNARAPSSKKVIATAKDYDDQARLMRERLITELWKN